MSRRSDHARPPPPPPKDVSPLPATATDSPRAHVSYHFAGLRLDSVDPVSKPVLQPSLSGQTDGPVADDDESMVRKRLRMLQGRGADSTEAEVPETPGIANKTFVISIGKERQVDPVVEEKAHAVRMWNDVDHGIFVSSAANASGNTEVRAFRGKEPAVASNGFHELPGSSVYPSQPPQHNRLPTISTGTNSGTHGDGASEAQDQRDLTWRHEEITGHNPNDPEDDGEGINGIGFKPTPAIARQRSEARRKQMEEYRSREAKEARAKRSQRRAKDDGTVPNRFSQDEKEMLRRVRFMETEVRNRKTESGRAGLQSTR